VQINVDFPDLAAWLGRVEHMLDTLDMKVDFLMASFAEAKQAWVDYTTALKTQRDDAVAALEAAQGQAQAAATALADFQANDEATDAQQLADQAQAFADDLSTTLESVKNPPAEPEPLPEP
jgi:hypothetical protein